MKKTIQLLTLFAFLISCGSTKNYSGKKDIDTELQNAVRVLNTNPKDEKAKQTLPGLYADVQHTHLLNIKKLKAKNKDRSPYWMEIISEYQLLQNAYNSITNSVAAHTIVTPVNYEPGVTQIKEEAAKHYYQLGESLLRKEGRENAQKALEYFRLCKYYVPGYDGVKSNSAIAYAKAVTNIVIDSIKDHSQHGKADGGKNALVSLNDWFREDLKTQLQQDFLNSIRPVAFYTDKDAAAKNIRADLIISLDLQAMGIAVSSGNISNTAPATPSGYVAENVVIYNPPVDGVGVGPQPWQPQYFGNRDVFTYPSVPGAVYSGNHTDFFVKSVLAVTIIDNNLRRNISSDILTESVQLSKYPLQGSGQIVADTALVQKLFGKFYPQIKYAVSTTLN